MYGWREESVLWRYYHIKEFNHDLRRLLIEFDNDDDDQYMQYDCVVKYTDKGTGTFHKLKLPASPIAPPEEEATHRNERFDMTNKLECMCCMITHYWKGGAIMSQENNNKSTSSTIGFDELWAFWWFKVVNLAWVDC